jgi:hypothetical protein
MSPRSNAPWAVAFAAALLLSSTGTNPKTSTREPEPGRHRTTPMAAKLKRTAPVFKVPTRWKTDPDTRLPLLSQKPEPYATPFQIGDEDECPGEGTGPDAEINVRKNRVDTADRWIPVEFDAVHNLKWPDDIRRYRSQWTDAERQEIARFEGIPISIEGYLAKLKRGGKEHCNCQNSTAGMIDYHLALVKHKEGREQDAIVVEVTPRIRAMHKQWYGAAISELVQDQTQVRISGWLLFDPYHRSHLGKFRATLWEIHPIMRIEVQQEGKWADLDDLEQDD